MDHSSKIGIGSFPQERGWVEGGRQRLKKSQERNAEWMTQERVGRRKVKQVDDKGGGEGSWMEMRIN